MAGGGTETLNDGEVATNVSLVLPSNVAVDASGNLYITEIGPASSKILKVNTSGIISTIAGTGVAGYSGDGGLATSAQVSNPVSIKVDRGWKRSHREISLTQELGGFGIRVNSLLASHQERP